MNSTRQIVRWSLPGLVFVLNVFVLHGLWSSLIGREQPWAFINEATTPAVVAALAGGLPAGFMIYQLYFHKFRPVGGLRPLGSRLRLPLFFRLDRGGRLVELYMRRFRGNPGLIDFVDASGDTVEPLEDRLRDPHFRRSAGLLLRPTEHLSLSSDHTASAPYRCAECVRLHTARSTQNWTLALSMIDICSIDQEWLKNEYTSGSDLYHGLGAARTAVTTAGVFAAGYDWVLRPILGIGSVVPLFDAPLRWLAYGVGLTAFVGLQLWILSRARDGAFRNYELRVAAALAFVSRMPETVNHLGRVRTGKQTPGRNA